jgi:hypothetical protein
MEGLLFFLSATTLSDSMIEVPVIVFDLTGSWHSPG